MPNRFIAGDLDGNGSSELIVDFGATGIWMNNAAPWVQLHTSTSHDLAVGDLDGNGRDELIV